MHIHMLEAYQLTLGCASVILSLGCPYMAGALQKLRELQLGEIAGFQYIRGRFRDPFFMCRAHSGDRLCKFGDLGRWHGEWYVCNYVDEVCWLTIYAPWRMQPC